MLLYKNSEKMQESRQKNETKGGLKERNKTELRFRNETFTNTPLPMLDARIFLL